MQEQMNVCMATQNVYTGRDAPGTFASSRRMPAVNARAVDAGHARGASLDSGHCAGLPRGV